MPALPREMISLWYGSVATIPPGWVICDGNNGTPDLRDRFVIGAGGAHAPDATGGTTQHNHTFTSDGHFHTLTGILGVAGGAFREDKTTTITDTGNTDNTNHLPPYHALVFIMRI